VGLLNSFEDLQKGNNTYVRDACLSVCMQQLGSYWTDICGILYFNISRKCVEKVQI
jgi:hypothetical protein